MMRTRVVAQALLLAGAVPMLRAFKAAPAAGRLARVAALAPRHQPVRMMAEGSAPPTPPQISVFEAQKFMEGGADGPAEVVYLDVRTESEFKAIRVPGSVLEVAFEMSPMGMQPVPDFLEKVMKAYPDTDAVKFVVGCKVGGRSNAVATALMANGYDASNITGGIIEWDAQGLPTESG
eukprot:CAMPEP_0118860626 /NCGR_PEP_ID=MMETSP1163-20130328/6391_1 /TAXON_ID=124430 /ORGANISM="Phaeomonas parva, Strain CCMP2877" /LENGTH=177 /DNA_ID=CAMNT_0006794343 /DNA_START=14 /DNA_END=547 /DNA_ORIENTATION=-